MGSVTDKQIMEAIEKYQSDKGYNPSIRDIMDLVGFKSTGGTRYRLDVMRKKGLIMFDDKIPRSIRVR